MIKASTIKKHVLPNLPYVMAFWFFTKCSEAYRAEPGHDALQKLMGMIANLNATLSQPMPSLNPNDLLAGLIGAAAVYGIVLYKKKTKKKWRKDIEYGSARWSA